MITIPVFIICRDRIVCLLRLLEWLRAAEGVEDILLIDNASTYPDLLQFYNDCPYQVLRLDANYGPGVFWQLQWPAKPPYAVLTDPDILPREDCPFDVVPRFIAALEAHPTWRAAALALEISDIPDGQRAAKTIRAIETTYWQKPIDADWFDAPIDTTFAVYRMAEPLCGLSVRSNYPYVARHLPWYHVGDDLPADEAYYIDHALPTYGGWYRCNDENETC